MPGERREVTVREVALLALGAALLAAVMHWPLVLNLETTIPKDLGDPLAQAWQAAWGGHALAEQPLDFFQSNQFWPLPDTLAFSDALVGYAPAGLIGEGPAAAIARYNVLFLFAYALAFAGAYLLARELGFGPWPALVAGAAFAFAPFRLEQDGHLHVISSGGIPLALALGLRGYRLRRPLTVVAAFAVATWQLSIGFSLGLPFAYLLALLGLISFVAWLRRGRPPLPRALVVATAAGLAIFLGSAFVLSRPYERVRADHPQSERPPEVVEAYSGPAYAFLVAPDENEVWGGATAALRDDLTNVPEKTLFPGLVILALAGLGLLSAGGVLPRPLRVGLGLGVLGVSVLALGFQTEDGLLWPYRVVYELLPGWQGIRTPGRLVTFSSLALALLAAGGAAALAARLAARHTRRRTPPPPTPAENVENSTKSVEGTANVENSKSVEKAENVENSTKSVQGTENIENMTFSAGWRGRLRRRGSAARLAALPVTLALLILGEGRGLPFDPRDVQAQPATPAAPPSVADVPAPQLHLPADRPEDNRRYLLWSTDGFPEIVNGRSSVDPVLTARLIAAARPFPDAESVATLRDAGVRSVILHVGRARGTAWEGAAAMPVRGLGLELSRRGGLLIYELASAGADSRPSAAD